jgi:hypothetical protein
MSDTSKFEQLLDLLVNEDKEKAEELFHDIVVEKSKEIYQGLIESEEKDEEVEEATEESKEDEVEEATGESDKEDKVEENFEEESVEEVGGDATDMMMKDVSDEADETDMDFNDDGKMDDHEEEHGDIEDRVVDLEDALDDLKAEFEAMMGDKGEGDEDEGEEEGEEESEEAEEEAMTYEASEEDTDDDTVEEAKEVKSAGETMREYVEKVSAPKNSEGSDNTASPVAKNAKAPNDAKAHGIGEGGEEKGGSAQKPKDMGKSFENEPGSKAGDTFKKASAPKSAE